MTQTDTSLRYDWLPTVDGFATYEAPETSQQVADFLATCSVESRPVVPVGAGRALALGNLTVSGAVALETRHLNQIRTYEPTDMTLSVDAGVSLAEITELIGARGQLLPVEAPYPETATIGGLLATGLNGPRRYGGGSLRDVLIGIEVAYPDGTVGRAGGMVVKNVSGFDLMRLHLGALGTLGVITSANFKVLARPRDEMSFVATVESIEIAQSISAELRSIANRPVALVVRLLDGQVSIAARYEGRAQGLAAVANRVSALFSDATKLGGADSMHYWQDLLNERQFDGTPETRVQIGVRPSDTFGAVSALHHAFETRTPPDLRIEAEPGLGQILVEWTGDFIDMGTVVPDAIVRMLDGPIAIRQQIDIWGNEPETIGLMRRLKQEYDPSAILNPGRYAGRL